MNSTPLTKVISDKTQTTTNSEIKISVITLVYNTGKYIVEAIDSLHAQINKNVEHIIVDDKSTDNSVALIMSHIKVTDISVLFLGNQKNLGIAASKNIALKHAKGEFILGLDDDILLPNRICHDLDLINTLPNSVALFASVAELFHADGNEQTVYGKTGASNAQKEMHEIVSSQEMLNRLKIRNSIPAITTCIRTSVLKEIKYSEDYIFEDYPTWIRIAQNGHDFAFSGTTTTRYRRGNHSVSQTKKFTMDLDTIRVGFDLLNWTNLAFSKSERARWVRLVSNAKTKELITLRDWCNETSTKFGILLGLRLKGMNSNWSWRLGNITSASKYLFLFIGPSKRDHDEKNL